MNYRPPSTKTAPKQALKLLEQAWAYYQPEPLRSFDDQEPELFQYYRTS